MSAFFRILAETGIIGYVVALFLEWLRPGLVVFFWNPQWLLALMLCGFIGLGFTEAAQVRKRGVIVILVGFVIVAAGILFHSFPASVSRYLAVASVVCMSIAFIFLHRKTLNPVP